MGRNSRKKTVKSQIVVPSLNEGDKDLIDQVSNTVASVFGKKRSRSLGDESRQTESIISPKRRNENDEVNNQKLKTDDLRNKLEEMKGKQVQENKRSRSRSRSKQRSISKQRKEVCESGSSEGESADEMKTFRRNGEKFAIERKIENNRSETVTTPQDFEDDVSDIEKESREFMQDIRPHDDNSEITFKRKAIEGVKDNANKRLDYSDDERLKKKRKTKSRSRSHEDREKEKRKRSHKKSKRRYYTSEDTSSDESDREDRKYKRKRSKKHKRRRSDKHSHSSDESSEDEKMSQIIKKVVQQLKGEFIPENKTDLADDPSNKEQSQNTNITSKSPIKSPSDSLTIYRPALNMINQRIPPNRFTYNSEASPTLIGNNIIQERNSSKSEFKVDEIDKILKSFRLDQQQEVVPGSSKTKTAAEKLQEEREAYAKEISSKAIIEAERNKAELIHPQGMSIKDINIPPNVQMTVVDTDDDFLHIVCHIEPQLVIKIQKGEFVELEKLLQKPEHLRYEEDSKKIVIEKEGERFCVPCKKENKISNVRKWEQAFRVYATIYSQANPVRASEIWQYVEVINQAAAKFRWENVARYDYIFRHLMARNPQRSWAKTYTQMWTLELCGGDNSQSANAKQNSFKSSRSGSNTGNQSYNWKDNCCWKFNKGDNCPHGKRCRYDHRCTYCGSYSHPSSSCPKKNGSQNQKKKRSSHGDEGKREN